MEDEINHKEEALINVKELNILHKVWGLIVRTGSLTAVNVSKII